MQNNNPKLVIGFITYGEFTAKYLPYFLPSLMEQTIKDFEIFAIDNSDEENNPNKDYIDSNYSEISLKWAGENIGFSRANNIIIRRAVEMGAKYVLLLNPDMVLANDAVEKMVQVMEQNTSLGSVAPKIYQWDFENKKKTKILDSCGIKEVSALRFAEVGRCEVDKGQFDSIKIIGPTGAAALYRMEALQKIKLDEKYFDELMFMYEEDCDLAYNLKIAGFNSQIVPNALIYHDRTAAGKGTGNMAVAINRRSKSRQIRAWGFLHKHIIFVKYWNTLKMNEKFEVLWFAFRMFVYALVFEQFLFKQYIRLFKIKDKIKIIKQI